MNERRAVAPQIDDLLGRRWYPADVIQERRTVADVHPKEREQLPTDLGEDTPVYRDSFKCDPWKVDHRAKGAWWRQGRRGQDVSGDDGIGKGEAEC